MVQTLQNAMSSLTDIYSNIPGLKCDGCWGECCVSPTLTLAEFVYMMNHGEQDLKPEEFKNFLSLPLQEHLFYTGNAHCRFQDKKNGRCQNYNGRAASCRIHGHNAMKHFKVANMEYCDIGQDPSGELKPQGLQVIFDEIAKINHASAESYVEPYYLMSLNLEGWIDFYYQTEISTNRPQLLRIHNILVENLNLPKLKLNPHTTLAGKLNTIDNMYEAFADGDALLVQELLQSTKVNFPSVGSYFQEEASYLLDMVENKINELNR